jgi:hypothetical protein
MAALILFLFPPRRLDAVAKRVLEVENEAWQHLNAFNDFKQCLIDIILESKNCLF